MHVGIGDSVENRNLRDDVNLSMDPDARLRASELCPSEYGHAEVNSRRVNGIEPSIQLELLRSHRCDRTVTTSSHVRHIAPIPLRPKSIKHIV